MRIPKHTTSPLPWKLKTRRTFGGALVVEVVDVDGCAVIDEVRDEDGAVYADYNMIVEAVNGKQEPHRDNGTRRRGA